MLVKSAPDRKFMKQFGTIWYEDYKLLSTKYKPHAFQK